jgi:hypothetical protein
MIIWNGLGFLPIVFLMVFGLGFSAESNGRMSDKNMGYTLLLTAIASGLLGWYLRRRPARVFIDKATGREIPIRPSHSLFFIPMIYWGPIFLAMAIYEFLQASK